MFLHSVSYDLLAPGRDYQTLYNRLAALGARRVLYSQWMLKSTMTAAQLRDDLKMYVDLNDRLFVINTTDGSMAWASSLMTDIKVAFSLT